MKFRNIADRAMSFHRLQITRVEEGVTFLGFSRDWIFEIMGELCLGTYLQILYSAVNEDKTNTKVFFVGEVLSLLTNDFDSSSTAMSKLFTGINNPTKELTKKAMYLTKEDYPGFTEDFSMIVMPMLNPNKLFDAIRMIQVAIAEDSDIKQDTEVGLITGLKKSELTGTVDNQAEFLAGVFLYVMKYTRNPGKSGVVRPIIKRLNKITPDSDFWGSKRESSYTSEKKDAIKERKRQEADRYDEQIEQKATSFCIKYDLQKNWIPLCQVVQISNPTKKHARKMFNDYCKCNRSVRQKILEINGIKKLELSDNDWWYEYLDMFEKDYRKYGLGAERYLYAFAQYFPRLLSYGDASVQAFIQRIFDPKIVNPIMKTFSKSYKYNVAGLIDEYIYYNKHEEYKNVLEPPMDYMWRELDFGSCPELMLASFLALFIIGTCRATPLPKGSENEMFVFSGPGASEVETAEDLFYQTLLTLYENYEVAAVGLNG